MRALSWAITSAIVLSMLAVLVAINRAALLLGYEGNDVDWVVVAATVIADALLIGIIYQLVHESLLALAERRRDNRPVPALLSGLLIIYTLVLWTILAPTINRFGVAAELPIFTRGWTEPESQLVRTAIVFAFVALSYYWIVWRYRRGGLVDAIAALVREFRAARARWKKQDEDGEGEQP